MWRHPQARQLARLRRQQCPPTAGRLLPGRPRSPSREKRPSGAARRLRRQARSSAARLRPVRGAKQARRKAKVWLPQPQCRRPSKLPTTRAILGSRRRAAGHWLRGVQAGHEYSAARPSWLTYAKALEASQLSTAVPHEQRERAKHLEGVASRSRSVAVPEERCSLLLRASLRTGKKPTRVRHARAHALRARECSQKPWDGSCLLRVRAPSCVPAPAARAPGTLAKPRVRSRSSRAELRRGPTRPRPTRSARS